MSVDFTYEDTPPTGTLRVLTDRARERRLRFYGRMRVNRFVPAPIPRAREAKPQIEPELSDLDRVAIIQEFIARQYEITREDLVGRCRRYDLAWPRQIAIFFANEFTDLTNREVGRQFSGRTSINVTRAARKIKEMSALYPATAAGIEAYRAIFSQVLA